MLETAVLDVVKYGFFFLNTNDIDLGTIPRLIHVLVDAGLAGRSLAGPKAKKIFGRLSAR